jgi:ABC-2 type transport system ATP-binding protein
MSTAVVVEDVRVAYGTTWALDGVDLDAARGFTLGVLGHNGAGKPR